MFQVKDQNLGSTKFVGRARAKVTDNRDPLQKGRIRVNHPVLGITGWIPYLKTNSVFDPPSINDIVYVEADAGYYTHPIAWGNVTRGPDNAPNLNPVFRREVPTNRGFHTPGGHTIELDDGIAPITQVPQDTNTTAENKGIRITSSGNNKIHIIEDTVTGSQHILIQDAGGNLIKLDYQNNELKINAVGKMISTVGGNQEETISGKLQITVTGDIDISTSGKTTINSSGETVVNGSTIKLNGSTGEVLTNITDPVIDLIYGTPTIGVPTVKAG